MKTAEMRFSNTCVDFGRCYANPGYAGAVEKDFLVLIKIKSFKLSEGFKSVAQGVLEIIEEVHQGGLQRAQCAWVRVNSHYAVQKWSVARQPMPDVCCCQVAPNPKSLSVRFRAWMLILRSKIAFESSIQASSLFPLYVLC